MKDNPKSVSSSKLIQWLRRQANSRYCLVALQIGDVHANYWNLVFRKSWQMYAERHGYDILVVQGMIDVTAGIDTAGIKFQKLKLLSLPEISHYEKVVYLDSDILLLEHAPCIASATPAENVGMVSQVNVPYREWHDYIQPIRGGEPTVEAYYQRHLLPDELPLAKGVDDILNGGVMVLEPDKHSAVFEEIFQTYKEAIHQKTGHIDQPLVSCELTRRNLVHLLDFRFNVIYSMWFALFYGFISDGDDSAMRAAMLQTLPLVYFLHFPSMRGVQYLPTQYFDRGPVVS